jgi:nitrogen fixation NifU-like protein
VLEVIWPIRKITNGFANRAFLFHSEARQLETFWRTDQRRHARQSTPWETWYVAVSVEVRKNFERWRTRTIRVIIYRERGFPMAYSDKVVDHYNNPRNVGTLDKGSQEVGTGLVGAPECGDVMRLQIKVNPETQVIEDAKFKTFGCGSAIASSSLATEWVKGKTVSEALAISNTDIVKELALPPVKIHCSVLAEDAIRAAIGDWKKKNNVAETEPASAVAAH